MPSFKKRTIFIYALLIAAIVFGLYPTEPTSLERNVGNAAFWWLAFFGFLHLIDGCFMMSAKSYSRRSFLLDNSRRSAADVKKRAEAMLVVHAFIAVLVAGAGHPWLATLWIFGAAVSGFARIEAKAKHEQHQRKATPAEAAEDSDARPA